MWCADVSTQFRQGLAAYAEKEAQIFEGLAHRSAGCWVNYLKAIGQGELPVWLLLYATYTRKIWPHKFLKDSGELDEDSLDEEEN